MSGKLLERLCPVCGSGSFGKILQKGPLRLVQCCDCRMVYANPVDEGWVSGLYYDELAVPYYLSADKVKGDYAPVRFDRELKLFRRFCKTGNVLDVGCSTGAFLFQLKSRCPGDYQVLGVDVAGPALDYAEQHGVPVLRESFLNKEFGGRQFAAVTFWAVLEHLADPCKFLFKAASILEPGGLCYILVPNFSSLATRLLGRKYRYIFPQHINYFTPLTLRQFAARAPEFRVLTSGSIHFNPIVIWQDCQGSGEFVSDSDRAELLKRTTGYKSNPWLKPLKMGLNAIETVLGRFNLADNIVLVLTKAAKNGNHENEMRKGM